MSEVTPTLEELKDLTTRKKYKKVLKGLIVILSQNKDNIQEFYNWLVELLKHDKTTFFTPLYYKFRDEAARILPAMALAKMDEYLLNSYAFSDVERLITSFRGTYKLPKAKMSGFLYLTKFRFLAHGQLTEKGKKAPGSGPKSLVGLITELKRQARRNAIKKALVAALGDKFTEDALSILPFNYPIIDAYNIKKSKNSISYTVTISYKTKRGKQKEEVLTFTVIPKKEKTETSDDFNTRKEHILNAIEETLLKAQTS